jgi:VIT1/CCC1 family predicted Fe2+/Mn2+ transporter
VELRDDFEEWKESVHAVRHGAVTWISFAAAGLVPLLPFLFGMELGSAFWASMLLAAATLFLIGALRTGVTQQAWWRSGVEMLLVGALAGAAAYLVGQGVEQLVDGSRE